MVSIHEDFSQQLLHRWDNSFQFPQDVEFHSEDEPYVDGLDRFDASEDTISRFMSLTHENFACQFKKQTVISFCGNINIEALERIVGSQKVSLIDEINNNESQRPPRGGLTASNLYKALRRPVSKLISIQYAFRIMLRYISEVGGKNSKAYAR